MSDVHKNTFIKLINQDFMKNWSDCCTTVLTKKPLHTPRMPSRFSLTCGLASQFTNYGKFFFSILLYLHSSTPKNYKGSLGS